MTENTGTIAILNQANGSDMKNHMIVAAVHTTPLINGLRLLLHKPMDTGSMDILGSTNHSSKQGQGTGSNRGLHLHQLNLHQHQGKIWIGFCYKLQ